MPDHPLLKNDGRTPNRIGRLLNRLESHAMTLAGIAEADGLMVEDKDGTLVVHPALVEARELAAVLAPIRLDANSRTVKGESVWEPR